MTFQRWHHKFIYSLPVQLLVNHFKKNQIFLLIWFFLFAFTSQNLGQMIGIPYLFLDPEYLNEVNFSSLLILGFSIGGFTMAFHITCYILDCNRFPFLGSLSNPFFKFCLNNALIPILYLITYCIYFIKFQTQNGFQSTNEIIIELSGFILGFSISHLIILYYFKLTNKDVFKLITQNLNTSLRRNKINRVNVIKRVSNLKKTKYKVDYFIDFPFLFKKIDHIAVRNQNKEEIVKVFDQNHLNAVLFELFALLTIVLINVNNHDKFFQIPAAASGILFFSMIMLLVGALSYWLRGWAITVVILVFTFLNYLMVNSYILNDYVAFGLNYNVKKANYSYKAIEQLSNSKNYKIDFDRSQILLNNWKSKFDSTFKPKMIFVCASGGGQRSAAWTLRTLQYLDSISKGKLIQNTILFTGASGGMVGAAYYRELYLRYKENNKLNPNEKKYFENICKDILNPVIFSYVINDLFFRFHKTSIAKREYLKDRGRAFEKQLDKNTENVLDKLIIDYRKPEFEGKIPMMILSPTIVNDGRKLYISAQDISYMNTAKELKNGNLKERLKGIELRKMFAEQSADTLLFLTALRMNATFPYITPNVILPSIPKMEIMDAGLTDNYGISDALRFALVFKDWIKQNTSGIIIISIRDSDKESPVENLKGQSIMQRIFNPIGSLYNNWDYLQDINNDNLIEYSQNYSNVPIDIINFEYSPSSYKLKEIKEKKATGLQVKSTLKEERAALSWHLTTKEKKGIFHHINNEKNQESVNLFLKILKQEKRF